MKRLHLHPLIPIALLAAVAVALGGCGVADPYAESSQRESEAAPVDDEHGKEPAANPYGDAPPDEVVSATAQGTLRYAASLADNWKGDAGAARAYSALTHLSIAEARAEFAAIAGEAGLTAEGALGYSETRASVVAVNVKGSGGYREAVIVTKQRVGSKQLTDLPPEYKVTLATLVRWGKGWAIASWEPQP